METKDTLEKEIDLGDQQDKDKAEVEAQISEMETKDTFEMEIDLGNEQVKDKDKAKIEVSDMETEDIMRLQNDPIIRKRQDKDKTKRTKQVNEEMEIEESKQEEGVAVTNVVDTVSKEPVAATKDALVNVVAKEVDEVVVIDADAAKKETDTDEEEEDPSFAMFRQIIKKESETTTIERLTPETQNILVKKLQSSPSPTVTVPTTDVTDFSTGLLDPRIQSRRARRTGAAVGVGKPNPETGAATTFQQVDWTTEKAKTVALPNYKIPKLSPLKPTVPLNPVINPSGDWGEVDKKKSFAPMASINKRNVESQHGSVDEWGEPIISTVIDSNQGNVDTPSPALDKQSGPVDTKAMALDEWGEPLVDTKTSSLENKGSTVADIKSAPLVDDWGEPIKPPGMGNWNASASSNRNGNTTDWGSPSTDSSRGSSRGRGDRGWGGGRDRGGGDRGRGGFAGGRGRGRGSNDGGGFKDWGSIGAAGSDDWGDSSVGSSNNGRKTETKPTSGFDDWGDSATSSSTAKPEIKNTSDVDDWGTPASGAKKEMDDWGTPSSSDQSNAGADDWGNSGSSMGRGRGRGRGNGDRGGRGGRGRGGGNGQPRDRSTDWPCSDCGMSNFNWRRECFKCQSAKPGDDAQHDTFQPPRRGASNANNSNYEPVAKRSRTDDWGGGDTASVCSNKSGSGSVSNDWGDTTDKKYDANERTSVQRSPSNNSAVAGPGGKRPMSEWTCPDTRCGSVNFDWRVDCFRCGGMKDSAVTTRLATEVAPVKVPIRRKSPERESSVFRRLIYMEEPDDRINLPDIKPLLSEVGPIIIQRIKVPPSESGVKRISVASIKERKDAATETPNWSYGQGIVDTDTDRAVFHVNSSGLPLGARFEAVTQNAGGGPGSGISMNIIASKIPSTKKVNRVVATALNLTVEAPKTRSKVRATWPSFKVTVVKEEKQDSPEDIIVMIVEDAREVVACPVAEAIQAQAVASSINVNYELTKTDSIAEKQGNNGSNLEDQGNTTDNIVKEQDSSASAVDGQPINDRSVVNEQSNSDSAVKEKTIVEEEW